MNTTHETGPERLTFSPVGRSGVQPEFLPSADSRTVDEPEGVVPTMADEVHTVLSAIEDSRVATPLTTEVHVEGSPSTEPTVTVREIVSYLLEADTALAAEAQKLDEQEGMPGMADGSDTKLQWGIRIGEVAGDRRRIRESVIRLADRLSAEERAQVLAAIGVENE